jgi:hypothetical protein
MELKGKLLDITRDIRTGEYRITLTVKEIPSGIDNLQDRDLRIALTRWTNKRTMTANAYYWVLVSKIAKVLGQTEPWVHNMLLCNYGQPLVIDGKIPYVAIKESAAAQIDVMESSTYHLKATSALAYRIDGETYRDYQMLKGSSQYDTEEMSQLIDGTVEEAKALGIETLPPAELERMMRDYEEHYSNGH